MGPKISMNVTEMCFDECDFPWNGVNTYFGSNAEVKKYGNPSPMRSSFSALTSSCLGFFRKVKKDGPGSCPDDSFNKNGTYEEVCLRSPV